MQNLRLDNLQGKKCAMFQVLFGNAIFDPCDLENEVKVKMMILDKSSFIASIFDVGMNATS